MFVSIFERRAPKEKVEVQVTGWGFAFRHNRQGSPPGAFYLPREALLNLLGLLQVPPDVLKMLSRRQVQSIARNSGVLTPKVEAVKIWKIPSESNPRNS